jgi:hypothetical protein
VSLLQQNYDYTSGSGVNQWTYRIIVDVNGNYYARILTSPLGAASAGLDIPKSVLDDVSSSIENLQAGGSPSGSSGSSGSSG